MEQLTDIKLSIPHLSGREAEYCTDAINSTWITPLGPYVDRFEDKLAQYLGVKHVTALSSGTAGIHLALADCGVNKDDTVLCQSMTFAASANPVSYLGAKPIFIDSEPDTWNMSPELLSEALAKLPHKPKAIVVVDLYGMPAKFLEIAEIAKKYDIPVIEDSAEALGSSYRGMKCGTICDYGVLSFNGNKMITTSGGGALITNSQSAESHIKFLATQARENKPYYYHKEIGYNYRLSNISAAIGCAQMEVLQERIKRRQEIHHLYKNLFSHHTCLSVHDNPSSDFNSNFWLTTITLNKDIDRDVESLRLYLQSKSIESRRLWRPMHMQPIFQECEMYENGVSRDLFSRGLCLPSSSVLTNDEIERVAEAIILWLNM